MDQNNDGLNIKDMVLVLLDTLKSEGTFDEFRRDCVSDIDAKPTYQNWKQLIESNVIKFLSKEKYTPELNKNSVRERLRKYLLHGSDTRSIEEGADRILNQVLTPRLLSAFEPKLEVAVNKYLGIRNEAPPAEQNGLKESNEKLMNVPAVEINTVSNSKTDSIMDTDHNENIDETSPEFEPLNSVIDNEDSNDESISGMSDLVSVGSPVQLVSTENHETHSNGFESDKNSMDKLLNSPLDKNGILNHKNDNLNIEPDDKTSDNSEKPKSNDLKLKNNVQSSRERRHSSSREKSSTHRSKDRNSSRHRSTSHRSSSQEKNDHKKYSSRRSKDRTNSSSSSHDKHRGDSNDKDKKQRRSKKSHHSDRDRSPKRDRKDSRSDKKEKSSSLCKEPKSLNGNRSDDESNGGGSSKQKSSVHKYKSSTSDKAKSSSSNHKSSRKDNGSKDVVDKLKDKSSTTKSSDCSSNKNVQLDTKKRKFSLEEPNNSNIEEKKLKWNELRSAFMTNDEQDAANILLSMREIPFESSQNEIITENIIFIENSSTVDNLKLTINTSENKLEVQENNSKCNNNDNEKEKLCNFKLNDLEVLKSIDSIASNYKDESINNSSLKKSCLQIIRDNSSCKDTNNIHSSFIENAKIDLLSNKKVESTESLKLKTTNSTEIIEMDLDPNKQVEFVEDVKLQISPIQNTRLDIKPCKEQFEFVKDDKLETSLTQNVEKQFSIKQAKLVDDVNLQLFNSIENVTINSKQNKQVELAEDLKLQSSSTETLEIHSKLSNVEDVQLETTSIINSRVESEPNKQFESMKSTKLHHISSTENIKIDSEPIQMVELVEDKIIKLSSIENVKIETEKQFELVNDEKEVKPLNVKINNSTIKYKTSECVSNDILKVPKLKLKLSPTVMKQEKRKKHHKSNDSKYKKMKSSKSFILDDVPVIDTVKTAVTCNQNDEKYKCDVVEVKESVSTQYSHILQNKKCESKNTQLLASNNSVYTFKGFSHEEAIPSKNYTLLKNFIKSIQNRITNYNVEMNDDYACTHEIRHNVEGLKEKSKSLLINSSEFQGLASLSKNNHNLINNDRFKDTACSNETNLDVENESNNSVCTSENNCSLADSNGYKSFASFSKNQQIMINGIVSNKLSYSKKNEFKIVDGDKCKSSVWINHKSHNTIIEKNKCKGIDKNFHPITNDNSVFRGFPSTDIKEDQKILKKRKLVSAQLLKLKKIAKGFKGFSERESQISKGYTFLKQQLELAKQQLEHTKEQNNVNNRSKNLVSGNNGIQNGRKLSNVMAIICDCNREEITTTSNQTNGNDNNIAPDETDNQSNNDNITTPNETDSQSNNDNITTPNQIINPPNNENMTSPNQTNNLPNNDDKNYSSAIINNNHDISTSNNWVVQQEMKYKLLPVKVKLERMLGYNCNNAKCVSESSSATTQRSNLSSK